MTWTIQSQHHCRSLKPCEAPCDRQQLHFTTTSPSATNLDCTWPPYPGLARFFLCSSSSRYVSLLGMWRIFIASSFKIGECLHKMTISLKNCRVQQNDHSFLANWPDRVVSSQHFRRFLDICLFICASLSLFHRYTPPPSNFFIHSLSLSVLSKTQL